MHIWVHAHKSHLTRPAIIIEMFSRSKSKCLLKPKGIGCGMTQANLGQPKATNSTNKCKSLAHTPVRNGLDKA